MTQVGETLRSERLKRHLDLEQISRELKIATKFLQAIENDQYDKLPGGVFAKSFVRQYARLLGLDDEEMAGQVEQVIAPLPLPQPPDKVKPMGFEPIQVLPHVEEPETTGDKRFRWSGWLSALVLVVVMLVCSAAYTWIQRPKPIATPTSVSAAQTAVQNEPPPAPAPAPDPVPPAPDSAAAGGSAPAQTPVESAQAPVQTAERSAEPQAVAREAKPKPVEPKPVEAKPVEAKRVELKPVEAKPVEAKRVEPKPEPKTAKAKTPGAAVHVEIVADEAVWVSARSDGKYKFSGTLEPHARRTVDAADEVTLKLGNAGGATVLVNGKPVGPVGPKGQLRTLQITPGGFTIVLPKSAPVDPLGRL